MRKFHLFLIGIFLFFPPQLLSSGERTADQEQPPIDLNPFESLPAGAADAEPGFPRQGALPGPRSPTASLAAIPPMEPAWRALGSSYQSAWGDIDGDGRLDLVVGGDGASLHLNLNGDLEAVPSWVSNSTTAAQDVALGDLDLDGDLDLVCANSSTGAPNTLYRNDGGLLTLDPVWTSSDSLRSQAVLLADFDDDGDLDLLFSNSRLIGDSPGPSKQLYRNDGGIITSTAVWESEAVEDGRGMAVGDLNEDGFLDLACANFGGAVADTFQYFGTGVSSAGDFNGDGHEDLITGSTWHHDGVVTSRAYIFFGGPGADSLADVILEEPADNFGASTAGAGDVNEDGFDDVVVGASASDVNGTNSGTAYLFYGGPSPDSAPDLILNGESAGDRFGASISDCGDVNGDGFADFLIGAPAHDGAGFHRGRVYVYFGASDPDTVPDLVIDGEVDVDELGYDVSGAGDVDGDGFTDFLAGAPFHDVGGSASGRAYLYLGGAVPDALPDLVIDGEAAADQFALEVSRAGDVNGDGFADILIGAHAHDGVGIDSGRAYVYFGGSVPDSLPDLVLDGETAGDYFGRAIAAAGDVNGDGFGDLLIGAQYHDGGGINRGRAYVFLGASMPAGIPDLVIDGEVDGDQAGRYLSGIDGWSGDGFSDIAVASHTNDLAGLDAGSVSVLYGSASPDGQPDLKLRGPDGAIWHGGRNSIYLSDQGVLPAAPTWQSERTDFSEGAVLGDVDGDGDLDLVFCGIGGPTGTDPAEYTWYRNDVDSIRTTPAWAAPVPGASYDLDLGDLDQDGDLDLVAVGFDPSLDSGEIADFSNVFINENGGYAQQADGMLLALGVGRAHGVFLADFDDDGDLDITVAGTSSFPVEGAVTLVRNDQQHWFSADTTWSSAEETETNGVALGDLDGDGDLDIAFANQGPQHAHMNDGGSMGRNPGWVSDHSWWTTDVAVQDLDRNGFPEAVFSTGYQQPFLVYNNTGVLSPVPWESLDKPFTPAIGLGDVNLDGKIDLVVGNATYNVSCGNVSDPDAVYHGTSGRFNARASWESDPPQGQTQGLAVADLDGDLDPDLICANTCGQPNTVYLNNAGSLSGSPDWISPETANSLDVKVGDTDGDGRPDLVYGRSVGVAVYRNLGDGAHFELAQALGLWARTIALGDVNADGRLDLVFGLWGQNGLYLNRGGSFDPDPVWRSSLSWSTNSIALGDLDQDGDLDLVCGNNSSGASGQKNTIYDGLRNPGYRGDPGNPTHHLSQNAVNLRGLTFESTSLTAYRVQFELGDIESDPVWIYPEYRIPPALAWSPMLFTGEGERVGPLSSSPGGTPHEFEWDLVDVLPTRNQIDVRIRWTPVPGGSVGLIRRSGIYLHELAAPPVRPVVDVPQVIAFPAVTIGDTAAVDLWVRNAGTDVLIVNDIRFSDGTMRTEHPRTFPVGVARSEMVPILLEADAVGSAMRTVTLVTTDPLNPEVAVDVQADVQALDARVQVLAPTPAPLGEALTVLVAPLTRVESGDLIFRLDRPWGNLPAGDHAVPLLPVGGEFIGIVPADAVTELGVNYYIRLANSGFTRNMPAEAPDLPFFHPVDAPDQMSVQAQPNVGSGYLEGLSINVQALLEQGTVFESGTLYHRAGGESDYRAQPLSLTGLLPAASIPDSLVDRRGIEYYVEVETAGGTRLTAPQANPAEAPYALQVTVLDDPEPESHPGETYRMVSFPFDFGPQFTGTIEALLSDQDEFGSYDPARWRAFRYLPASHAYVELSDESASSEFTPKPGRAFWLISKSRHRVDTKPISSLSTRTDVPAEITLAPGWNQIGNPYAFPVSWTSTRVDGNPVESSSVQPPVFWNGGTYELDRAILRPFEGYWVFNGNGDPAVLDIEPVEATGPVAGPRRGATPLEEDAAGWEVRISAVSARTRDDSNVAGVRPGASAERDSFDRSDPPPVPGHGLSVQFPHRAWAEGAGSYTADYRPPLVSGAGGHAWAFDISKTFSKEESGDLTTLQFDVADVPADVQVFLLDRRFDRLVNLREQDAYECFVGKRHAVSSEEDARFEFLAGSETFVRNRREAVAGIPFRNRLFQNYPNPFRSDTMIRYEVAEPAPVRLQVFDAQGRLVRSLLDSNVEAGRYEARWNGRDDQEREAAPGIYFFRLTSPHLQQTRRMVLIR